MELQKHISAVLPKDQLPDINKQIEKTNFEWTMNSELKRKANDYRRESSKEKRI